MVIMRFLSRESCILVEKEASSFCPPKACPRYIPLIEVYSQFDFSQLPAYPDLTTAMASDNTLLSTGFTSRIATPKALTLELITLNIRQTELPSDTSFLNRDVQIPIDLMALAVILLEPLIRFLEMTACKLLKFLRLVFRTS